MKAKTSHEMSHFTPKNRSIHEGANSRHRKYSLLKLREKNTLNNSGFENEVYSFILTTIDLNRVLPGAYRYK